jgi:hypothetical protein
MRVLVGLRLGVVLVGALASAVVVGSHRVRRWTAAVATTTGAVDEETGAASG